MFLEPPRFNTLRYYRLCLYVCIIDRFFSITVFCFGSILHKSCKQVLASLKCSMIDRQVRFGDTKETILRCVSNYEKPSRASKYDRINNKRAI